MSIGKILVKNNVFESMSVFAIITLLFRDRILGESLYVFPFYQLLFASLYYLRIVNVY